MHHWVTVNFSCSSFRLRPLYPRTTVLEIRSSRHELAGGLSSLRRRGFFCVPICLNSPVENQKHVFPIFFFFFWHWRGKSWIGLFKSDETITLSFAHTINTHQFQHLLRKIKICFLRLGTSCAAILIFILHIFPPYEWNLSPGLTAYNWGWDFWLVLYKQNQCGLYH